MLRRLFVVALLALGLVAQTQAQPVGLQIPARAHQYRLVLTQQAYAQWGLDAPIAALAAQVHKESAWRPEAVSHVGARGLAQFMPATAAWWCAREGIDECLPHNPKWALRAMVGYDKFLFDRAPPHLSDYDKLWLALRGYNGGERHWQAEARTTGLREPTREQIDATCGRARRHRKHCAENLGYGTGLGLQLFWPVFFKRRGVLSWNKFCDRFGTPTPWGKYPRSASAREKGTLFDALRAFSNDGFVMTPEGTMIELLESKLSSTGLTPNQSLVEYMDDWIAEVLLGQAPRGGSGGALAAAANEREDVRLELSQADSDLLSETLNATLIKWICELNGLQECVVYRSITKEADLKLESETDVNVASLGFRPTLEYVRGKYGDGWDEAELAAPTASPDKPAPSSFAEPGAPAPEKDAIDELIQQELDQWRPVMEPMVSPVRDLMQHAAAQGWTAQQLLDELPKLLPQMDDSELMAALLRTSFAARAGAAAGVENE